jgi:hypothetical protein
MNPTQINQLELNPVINEKMATTIKKSTAKTDQREKRSCINPHRLTNAAVQRQRMYHGSL